MGRKEVGLLEFGINGSRCESKTKGERIIANGQARGDEGRKWGPGRVIPKGTGHHHKKNIEKGENFTGRGEGR
jgi:hypothetical protein